MPIFTSQSRYQKKITITLAPEPPGGWPEDKHTSPGIIHIPAREGPYVITLISGTGLVEASISSRQDVSDNLATWFEWPPGLTLGPVEPEVLEEAEALRLTASGGDAIFEIMGVRS